MSAHYGVLAKDHAEMLSKLPKSDTQQILEAIAALADGLRARDADLKEIHRKQQEIETLIGQQGEGRSVANSLITGSLNAINGKADRLESMLTEQKQQIHQESLDIQGHLALTNTRIKWVEEKLADKPKQQKPAKQRRAKR